MTNDEMREETGCVTGNKLDAFLYVLMRDTLTFGKLEKLVMEAEKTDVAIFTNGWLGRYAKNLATRLTTNYIKMAVGEKIVPRKSATEIFFRAIKESKNNFTNLESSIKQIGKLKLTASIIEERNTMLLAKYKVGDNVMFTAKCPRGFCGLVGEIVEYEINNETKKAYPVAEILFRDCDTIRFVIEDWQWIDRFTMEDYNKSLMDK